MVAEELCHLTSTAMPRQAEQKDFSVASMGGWTPGLPEGISQYEHEHFREASRGSGQALPGGTWQPARLDTRFSRGSVVGATGIGVGLGHGISVWPGNHCLLPRWTPFPSGICPGSSKERIHRGERSVSPPLLPAVPSSPRCPNPRSWWRGVRKGESPTCENRFLIFIERDALSEIRNMPILKNW